MMKTVAPTIETLRAETGWLRRLAQSLVKDAAAADDVVQDTLVIATTRAPTDGRPLGPWLARVLLNRVRMIARSASRRDRRERAIAEVAVPPAPLDAALDRVRLQRLLIDLVLALEPPLRDIVVMRYVDDLSSVEIGKRLGLPDATVRWRLRRAIAVLRERLDERAPNRAWIAPMTAVGQSSGHSILGAAAIAAVAVLLALVGTLAWLAHPTDSVAGVPRGGGTSNTHAPALAELDDDLVGSTRAISAPEAPLTWPRKLALVVLDRAGQPAGPATLGIHCGYFSEEEHEVTTGDDGRFELAVDRGCSLNVTARKGEAVARGYLFAELDRQRELVLRLEPAPVAIVHVVDDRTGEPIADAGIYTRYRQDKHPSAVTTRAGVARLALAAVPMKDAFPIEITIDAPGYPSVTERFRASNFGSSGMTERTVRLKRGVTIAGTVIDAAGRAAYARVQIDGYGDFETRCTDSAGAFVVAVPHAGRYRARVQPLDRTRKTTTPAVELEIGDAGRADIVLTMRDEPVPTVTGTVLDPDGRPVAGARVTGWGRFGLEKLKPDSPFAGLRPLIPPVVTDARGAFSMPLVNTERLGDLHLVANHGEHESELVPITGDPVRLRLGPTGIAGIVTDLDGNPVADADIYLNPGTAVIFGRHIGTDAAGRFSIDVPRAAVTLSVRRSAEDDFDDRDDRVVVGGSRNVRLTLP